MGDPFESTLWSRIEGARKGDTSAVETFVARYQSALVRFIRAQGYSKEDGEDLAQEVFLRLFAREALARADRERGRFRAFLVGVTKNVIREERKRRFAQKRGGGRATVPLSEAPEIAAEQGMESGFETIWAEQLLQRGLEALQREHPRQYETLALRFQEGLSNPQIAERMGGSLTLIRNDLHRGRKRVLRAVRQEILDYASSSAELEDDLALFAKVFGLEP